jgi:hypothetical protein
MGDAATLLLMLVQLLALVVMSKGASSPDGVLQFKIQLKSWLPRRLSDDAALSHGFLTAR